MALLKIPHNNLDIILSHYEPSEDIMVLKEESTTPYELIQAAVEKKLFLEAINFLAHALPVREAIWWAACCASHKTHWNEDEWNAIQATKAWVNTPDEISRRHAEQMANKAQLKTGAGWAAMAAFWSGGSMIAPSDPLVPPPPYLYAKAVSGCIGLSAALPDTDHADDFYKKFINIGLDIANGGNGSLP